jgi:ribosome-binding protein aMBF1 (putative translation factor)
MIYRAIRPLFALKSADIFHHDASDMSQVSAFSRDSTLAQALSLDTEVNRRGAAIRVLRLQKGWSQQELARRSEITAAHLSCIEHGRFKPRAATLKRIERALQSD